VKSSGSTYVTLIEHWDGAAWSAVPSPNNPGANELNAVSILPTGLVWAVGDGGARTLIVRNTQG